MIARNVVYSITVVRNWNGRFASRVPRQDVSSCRAGLFERYREIRSREPIKEMKTRVFTTWKNLETWNFQKISLSLLKLRDFYEILSVLRKMFAILNVEFKFCLFF